MSGVPEQCLSGRERIIGVENPNCAQNIAGKGGWFGNTLDGLENAGRTVVRLSSQLGGFEPNYAQITEHAGKLDPSADVLVGFGGDGLAKVLAQVALETGVPLLQAPGGGANDHAQSRNRWHILRPWQNGKLLFEILSSKSPVRPYFPLEVSVNDQIDFSLNGTGVGVDGLGAHLLNANRHNQFIRRLPASIQREARIIDAVGRAFKDARTFIASIQVNGNDPYTQQLAQFFAVNNDRMALVGKFKASPEEQNMQLLPIDEHARHVVGAMVLALTGAWPKSTVVTNTSVTMTIVDGCPYIHFDGEERRLFPRDTVRFEPSSSSFPSVTSRV